MDGTKVYENFVPDHDATVVTRLKDAGAVLLGKLTLSEAAMAGALNVRLGGANKYDGVLYDTPLLNPEGRAPSVNDARAALALVAVVSGIAYGMALLFLAGRRRRW